jgi:hypothetical protein
MRKIHFNFFKVILILVTFVWLFISVNKIIKATPLNSDSLSNLHYSYVLAHYGINGIVSSENPILIKPNSHREPFPNWLSSNWIKTHSILFDDQNLYKKQSPEQLIELKKINTWILIATLLGVFTLASSIFNSTGFSQFSFLLAYLTLILSYACMHTIHVDYFITEIHGALLLVWFSWAWLKLFKTSRWQYAILSGVFLGLLILTKAAFLYISFIVAAVTMIVLLIQSQSKSLILNHLLLFMIASTLVLPWMYRNYVQLGKFEVAGRGSVVLMTRAFKSQMTDEEFKGAFYAYAPLSLKRAIENITGFSAKDREFGGRLQRLYRAFDQDEQCRDLLKEDCAIAYYYQASIRYRKILRSFKEQYPNDAVNAKALGEEAAKKYAINMIKNNPWGHLRTTLVFAWRGAWPCNTVDGRWYDSYLKIAQPAWQEILPFLGLISMFSLAVIGLIKKQKELIALTWLSSAAFLFYALATHFIPRYSEMMIPIWVLCFVYICALILNELIILFKKIVYTSID